LIRPASVLLSLAFCSGLSQSADAHPHVFIDGRVAFVFDAGKVTSLRLHWGFDEIFSDDLLAQFDADGNGAFDELESKAVGDGVLPNLKAFRYFTYVWVDGKQLDPIDPADFHAQAQDRVVTFEMSVPLPASVDPRTQALAVEINDREYYVAVELAAQDPIALVNAEGVPCSSMVRDDTDNAYFGGFVIPQEITLQCR